MQRVKGKLSSLLLGSMMVLVAAAACVENTPINKAPVARIGSPVNGAVFDTGVIITFDGSGSYDPEKKALTFSWNFGDNTNGTGNRTAHSYALPGKYIVGLEVSDGNKKGNDRAELNITQANRAPAVRFSVGNATVSNEETVAFNASETTDADNDALAYSWSFGDGTVGQGKLVSHMYPNVGAYNVTLNVSDGKTTSSALQAITVYQANRAPAPKLKATPLVAFINSSVEFDASGSTDADNDSLTAAWDFGDGATGAGQKAGHAYPTMGNFTIIVTVSDGKAERTANVIVTVLPRAKILIDWNQTDYGYIIQPEVPVDGANISVSVAMAGGPADNSAAVETLARDRYRATSTVIPMRGATLTVTARYWGLAIGSRTMTIYENTPMPGQNCTATFDASMSTHTFSSSSDSWFNISGEIGVVVRDLAADYSMRITGGTSETRETTDTGNIRAGTGRITGGWYNQTLDAGMQTGNSMDIAMDGNSTTTNGTGSEIERFHSVQETKKAGHNTTEASLRMDGTQYGAALSYSIATLGIEEHANGDGKLFSCIKLRFNYSADAYVPNPPGGPLHMKYFSDDIQWNVQDDDHYVNTTIYHEYLTNVYLVNETTGEWTLAQNTSGSEYPDSDGDGRYNPDPKPLGSDEAFTFHGLIPRELIAGDRITGTNEHDVTVVLESQDGGQRTVDGVTYTVVLLKGTFSGAGGNASGTSENWIVSQGDLTGLTLESKEQKRWAGEGAVEESTTGFNAVRIEEE
jgi:hypothetical protein